VDEHDLALPGRDALEEISAAGARLGDDAQLGDRDERPCVVIGIRKRTRPEIDPRALSRMRPTIDFCPLIDPTMTRIGAAASGCETETFQSPVGTPPSEKQPSLSHVVLVLIGVPRSRPCRTWFWF
jgi:hypothetical protein